MSPPPRTKLCTCAEYNRIKKLQERVAMLEEKVTLLMHGGEYKAAKKHFAAAPTFSYSTLVRGTLDGLH